MSERRVYIAQLLCPQRHCILAAAEEFDTAEEAESLRKTLEGMFDERAAERPGIKRCALCQSTDFHIEIGRTTFRTIEEAKPVLFLEEARQYLTQMWLKMQRN
jgi:hypothetical protein